MEEVREQYESYERRLETFKNWKSEFPTCKLAKAGFIYSGEDDIVICPFCQTEGFNWQQEDNPLEDHMDWNPYCIFFDIDDYHFIKRRGRGSIYFDKNTFDSRLETYKDWPISMVQKPNDLAKAGYFYTGCGDIIKCFHCGTSLKNLLPTDNVNQLHTAKYDKCEFLQMYSDKDESVNLNCKICMVNELSVLFMPCKHLACCMSCSLAIEECCICRKEISGYFKVYLS